MRTEINVEQIACASCAGSIGRQIGIVPGVYGINLDLANRVVVVDHTEDTDLELLKEKLKAIGYSLNE